MTDAHIRPKPAWIGAALRILRQPVHVAMGAGFEKFAEMPCSLGNRIRRGDADAVEAERACLRRERTLQLVARQKSRST